ncbi:sulfite dehydrogenase [Bradyrhizobium sp. RDT10]
MVRKTHPELGDPAAGNGILSRRIFLEGALVVGATGAGLSYGSAEPLTMQPWMKVPGPGFAGYGQPSPFESKVVKVFLPPPATPGVGASRTPLHLLEGIITPSGLHFERSHSGVPEIDPDQHRLVIHGLVKRPLVFTIEALSRYPMQSRIAFIECGGNSQALNAPQAQPLNVTAIHGLVGCSEWTGVPLSTLLDEAGVEPAARWVIAEGADAAAMSRSIPIAKAMDDALVCLYQNGERVRPSNGYPVRLLLPGFEGNMNVKWLRRLKLTGGPAMTKDETSKYTILLKDEKAWQFVFPMEVKSFIARPSPGLALTGPGFYEISGLAWSGNGSIRQVEVSADGGQSWAPAALQGPILPKAPVRFRAAWQWNGGPAVLQSRATDDTGMVQPTREQFAAERGLRGVYHYNAIASWRIDEKGRPAMFTLKCIAVGTSMLTIASAALAQAPQFGQPIAPADIAAWDISIGPDGVGLPPGRGTAIEGEAIYVAKCQACHGEKGTKPSDALAGALVGGMGTLAPNKTPIKTVGSFWPYATTLFDYVRRAMPFQESKSLTADEVYAVSAYILNLNGIIGPTDVIDAHSLPKVRMPNRDGFIPFPRNPK